MCRNLCAALAIVGISSLAPSLRGQEAKPAEPQAPATPAEQIPVAPTPVVEDKSALDMLPAELVNAKGEKVSKETLKGKIVGLYFSAHWCPPCRAFTPQLVAFRDAHSAEFEVVFISSDKTAEAMKKYMEEARMQWPAVGFDDPAAETIQEHFNIQGIPSLIILGADGRVITKNGRRDVTGLKDGALAEWKK